MAIRPKLMRSGISSLFRLRGSTSTHRDQLAQAELQRAALKPCAEVYQFSCLAGTTFITAQRVLRETMAGALPPPT